MDVESKFGGEMKDRQMQGLSFLTFVVFVTFFAFFHEGVPVHAWPQSAPAAAPAGQKVPDDIGIRIKNNQLDAARLQNQMMQLSQQYQADQQAVEHGTQELASLKREALEKAKLDPATNDVDVEKLVFIAKPAPSKPPEAKK
jgi:hypothetical protein